MRRVFDVGFLLGLQEACGGLRALLLVLLIAP